MDPHLANFVTKVVTPAVGVMFAVAVAYFIYGIVEYVAGSTNPEKREIGVKHIVWGIVGLAIMVSVYGIINFVQGFWKTF